MKPKTTAAASGRAGGCFLAVWFALSAASPAVSAEAASAGTSVGQGTCTYDTYQWNAIAMQPVGRERVTKPRSDLTGEEVDPATGCSVCIEDQVEVRLEGVKPFRLCRTWPAGSKGRCGTCRRGGCRSAP